MKFLFMKLWVKWGLRKCPHICLFCKFKHMCDIDLDIKEKIECAEIQKEFGYK